MSEIRRGSAAIEEAAERSGSGEFKPFLPSIYWKDSEDERYVLFLNDVEDLPTFDMIQFIPIPDSKFFAETVSKTDQYHGKRSDAFEDDWDATPRKTTVAIAVELEPIVEVVKTGDKTRRKPRSFEVKTIEFERRILDDDGEVTDETEEVTAPCVGYIAQSPNNFFKPLSYFDANESPITTTALKITRIGKDTSTSYQFTGFDEVPIDLSGLVEYIDGISYLNDEMDDLVEEIADLDLSEAALVIGSKLLDKREEELLDDERYQELLAGVTESMDTFGSKKKKAKGKKKDEPVKRTRRSPAKAAKAEPEAEAPADDPDEPATDPEPTEEVKPARKTRKAAEKASPKTRMDELRAKAAERAAARK